MNILGKLVHVMAKSQCTGEKTDKFKSMWIFAWDVDALVLLEEGERGCLPSCHFPRGKIRFNKLLKNTY